MYLLYHIWREKLIPVTTKSFFSSTTKRIETFPCAKIINNDKLKVKDLRIILPTKPNLSSSIVKQVIVYSLKLLNKLF